jgi:hypothetical protein
MCCCWPTDVSDLLMDDDVKSPLLLLLPPFYEKILEKFIDLI